MPEALFGSHSGLTSKFSGGLAIVYLGFLSLLFWSVSGCSNNDSIGGKTTTTTNGLAVRNPGGGIPGQIQARMAMKTWDYGTESIEVLDLHSDAQAVLDIPAGEWAVVQLMNDAGDSGVWLEDFTLEKDSVLEVEFQPLLSVRESLDIAAAGKPFYLRGGIQSSVVNDQGVFELTQIPAGKWEMVTRDSVDVIRGVLYAIDDSAEFARALDDYVAEQQPAALLVDDFSDGNLDAFPGGEVPGAFWDLFESGAVLIQPADLSEEELLQSFTDSGTIQVQYEEFETGSWVALSLFWPGRMDVRQLDSLCVDMTADGNMKIEFVSPKLEDNTQAPGFYQNLSGPLSMDTYCFYPAQWDAASTNPDSLLVWDEFAQSVSALQILGRHGSTEFEIRQIEFFGQIFLRDP